MRRLGAYQKKVAEAAKNLTTGPIFNSDRRHAAIVIKQLFNIGEREFLIFTSGLNPHSYSGSEIVYSAQKFMQPENRVLKILVEKHFHWLYWQSHEMLCNLPTNDGVQLKLLPKEISGNIPFHFVVVDGLHYRFEHDKTRV